MFRIVSRSHLPDLVPSETIVHLLHVAVHFHADLGNAEAEGRPGGLVLRGGKEKCDIEVVRDLLDL